MSQLEFIIRNKAIGNPMAHLYHLKVKAGGNLHLLPLMRGVGYLFRPQLLSLLFYAIYIIIIALYVKNIQYLFKIYFLYGIKAFLFLYFSTFSLSITNNVLANNVPDPVALTATNTWSLFSFLYIFMYSIALFFFGCFAI